MDCSKDSIRIVKKELRMIPALVNQNHENKIYIQDYSQKERIKKKGRGERVMMQTKKILLGLVYKSKACVGMYFSCEMY